MKDRSWHSANQVSRVIIIENPVETVNTIEDKERRTILEKKLVVLRLALPPTSLSSLTTEGEARRLEEANAKLKGFLQAHPRFEKTIRPILDGFQQEIYPKLVRFKRGDILESGSWITSEERKARELAAIDEENRKAAELKRYEDEKAREEEADRIAEAARLKLIEEKHREEELARQKQQQEADQRDLERRKANLDELAQLSKSERESELAAHAFVLERLRHLRSVTSIGLSFASYQELILKLAPETEEGLRKVRSIGFREGAERCLAVHLIALELWRDGMKTTNQKVLVKPDIVPILLRLDVDVSNVASEGLMVKVTDAVPVLFSAAAKEVEHLESYALPEDSRPILKKLLDN